jgi:hypothetical protein
MKQRKMAELDRVNNLSNYEIEKFYPTSGPTEKLLI